MSITREQIISSLRSSFEPKDYILAMWEGGSAAHGRVDEWSDIDCLLIAEDNFIDHVLGDLEECLETLSPIAEKWIVPKPTWHGHEQVYYQLADASKYLVVDCCIIKKSNDDRYLEKERHGVPIIHFDKEGLINVGSICRDTYRGKIDSMVKDIRDSHKIFSAIVNKEIRRGRVTDALAFYNKITLKPLVDLYNVIHRPEKFDFGMRYLREDFPPALYQDIQELMFVSDLDDLKIKQAKAEKMYFDAWNKIKESDWV